MQNYASSRAVGVGGGGVASSFGANNLTLSQPEGQIMPATLLHAPWILRPSYGPEFEASLSSALQASKM
jgi:hypothetical protein